MKITLLGIDIAKNVFELCGVDKTGRTVFRKSVYRSELLKVISQLPACTIAMEACASSHYWARQFQNLGHEVKLISPQFVKPFVKSNKNDVNDAEAITEAASRPNMRFVPIKQTIQQDIQSLHRMRQRNVRNRTALSNQIRGLLLEYGIAVPYGITRLRKMLPVILEDKEDNLTPIMKELCQELYEELILLDEKIALYDKKIVWIAKDNPICQKLMAIEGIGPLIATSLLTVLSNAKLFKNGRHFAAFLGLVPRQQSSGGKQRLLGISKRGDCYIRMLLIQGAQSALQQAKRKLTERNKWILDVKERCGTNKASVALANKNARIAWSLIANNSNYQKQNISVV